MPIGTVKFFNDAKGYGFITREEGADVFVHHASIIAEGFRTLAEGDRVSFEVVDGPKGPQAKNVVRVTLEPFQDALTGALVRLRIVRPPIGPPRLTAGR